MIMLQETFITHRGQDLVSLMPSQVQLLLGVDQDVSQRHSISLITDYSTRYSSQHNGRKSMLNSTHVVLAATFLL